MPTVVTANRLHTGDVVYLAAKGRWVADLAGAAVAEGPGELAPLEAEAKAAVERNEVTAVYAFDVRVTDGKAEPVSVRERIRAAHGPSI